MQIFKNKAFNKWAAKEGLSDQALYSAVDEMEHGLINANLGGHVMKKRVALGGRGKSAGVRTIIVYQVHDKAFFIYGFAKNARDNISKDEKNALKHLAQTYLSYDDQQLQHLVKTGTLIEVQNNE